MIFFVWLMVNSEKLMSRGLARSCQQIESDGVLTLETSAFCNSLREFTRIHAYFIQEFTRWVLSLET